MTGRVSVLDVFSVGQSCRLQKMGKTCSICGNTYTNKCSHLNKCKSPKKPGPNAAGQEEVSSSARDGKDLLAFHVVRQPRSSRPMKDMDEAEALVLLQEPRGKDKSSDDEPGVEHSGVELAADNPDVSLGFDAAIAVINLLSLKPKRNSASVDLYGGTEKCANEALLVDTELTHNDDGQGLVDCPENSAVMELKQPKLDLKVSDNSENAASDDAQGGINDASGLGMLKEKQASLSEPMARDEDQEPKQNLDALDAPLPPKEQAAKATTSVDDPGTDNLGEESGADKSDEVLTSCSEKSSCSVECYEGGESTSDLEEAAIALLKLRCYGSASSAYPYEGTEKSGNEAPAVEEEELSREHSHQTLADCPEKSAATELKNPKLDHKVLDNSVVMQEEKQKVDLSDPAPGDGSEEERSDIIEGQANQTA